LLAIEEDLKVFTSFIAEPFIVFSLLKGSSSE